MAGFCICGSGISARRTRGSYGNAAGDSGLEGVTACRLVNSYRRFEAPRSFETPVLPVYMA